jgi:glycerol kinase
MPVSKEVIESMERQVEKTFGKTIETMVVVPEIAGPGTPLWAEVVGDCAVALKAKVTNNHTGEAEIHWIACTFQD